MSLYINNILQCLIDAVFLGWNGRRGSNLYWRFAEAKHQSSQSGCTNATGDGTFGSRKDRSSK